VQKHKNNIVAVIECSNCLRPLFSGLFSVSATFCRKVFSQSSII